MITNGTFGPTWGRMGNQVFQLALLFAVAQRHGYEFYLPHNGQPLWDCFDLDVPAEGPQCSHPFDEVNGSCNYDPRVFEQPDGTSYNGYFQSYRYLEECKPSLVQFLRFRFEHRALSEAVHFACRRQYRQPLVSLHIRRDDYLLPGHEQFGDLAAEGYYERAVEAIGHDVVYLVFSDDLPWCREFLQLERVEFVELDHCSSLCLMTLCDVNVVANSSFSWWGAYLNPGAEVYAPSRWFTEVAAPPNDVQNDIVPPSWRTIPVFGDTAASRYSIRS